MAAEQIILRHCPMMILSPTKLPGTRACRNRLRKHRGVFAVLLARHRRSACAARHHLQVGLSPRPAGGGEVRPSEPVGGHVVQTRRSWYCAPLNGVRFRAGQDVTRGHRDKRQPRSQIDEHGIPADPALAGRYRLPAPTVRLVGRPAPNLQAPSAIDPCSVKSDQSIVS